MKIVIDHVAGSRRGQRQDFDAQKRVRFGRHPDCEVSFDALRDIDASSRHAELRPGDNGWVLVDVGSSNGTYVDGRRVTELAIAQGSPVMVEFGSGGPSLRLFIGDDAAVAQLGEPPAPPKRTPVAWIAVAAIVAIAAVVGVILALR
ncbi:MAG TPA: FHA domain-containing protein [Kofleriaceae bacterium]|nr:FHA domain-containing protein [Kofleriaceae bacterium]